MTTVAAYVRAVLDESDATDPETIAALVLARIPKRDLSVVLHPLMVSFVGSIVSRGRTGAVPPARPSVKVGAVRDAYESWLRERISVGPSEWRMLGDCTVADLRYAAEVRRDLAVKNAATAEQFAQLADALESSGASTVRDLPSDVVAAVAA